MVRMDGAEARKERIAQIARMIQAALYQAKDIGFISFSKTVSKVMVESGLTKNKVSEYLHLLNDIGQFEVDEKEDKIKRAEEEGQN